MSIDFHPNYNNLNLDKFKIPSEDYESPITVFVNEACKQIVEQRENAVLSTIREQYAINIEKDELIKALNYDRDQYNKGFQAGYERARTNFSPKQGEWITIDAFVVKCSVCGVESFATPFCPHCGADMRGAK